MDTNPNQLQSPQPALEQTPVPPKPSVNSRTLLIAVVVSTVIMFGLITYVLSAKTKPISKSLTISPTLSQPSPTPVDETANWKTYTYPSIESGILPDMTFKYPSLFGNKPTLISSRNTNRPENISEDWGGLFEFNPTGAFGDRGLRIEFFKRVSSENSFGSYVSKSATSGGWGSPKYFQAGSYKVARIRFSSPSHYDADVGWYFVELSNKSILAISTSGDKKFLYDDDQNGNSTRDQILSTFQFSN